MAYLKIEGHEGYVKNPQNGIVLNVNKEEIEAAERARLKKLDEEFTRNRNKSKWE